jgi:hypothetical protein
MAVQAQNYHINRSRLADSSVVSSLSELAFYLLLQLYIIVIKTEYSSLNCIITNELNECAM